MTVNITLFRNTMFVAFVKDQPMFDGQGCWCSEELKSGSYVVPDMIIFGYKRDVNEPDYKGPKATFEEIADYIRFLVPKREVLRSGVIAKYRQPLKYTPQELAKAKEYKSILHKLFPHGCWFIYEGEGFSVKRLASRSKAAKSEGVVVFEGIYSPVSFGLGDTQLMKDLKEMTTVAIQDEEKARTTFSRSLGSMFARLTGTPDIVVYNQGNMSRSSQGFYL